MSTLGSRIPPRASSAQTGGKAAQGPFATTEPARDILVAIRRIIRATDLHSKQLMRTSGLTTPQLLVLQAVDSLGDVTVGRISSHVSLSQATVTTIVDRLERGSLLQRYRSIRDRRVIHLRLTPQGRRTLVAAPDLLQESFVTRLTALPRAEQSRLLAALQQVATMMDAGDLDAAPLLDVGATVATGAPDAEPPRAVAADDPPHTADEE